MTLYETIFTRRQVRKFNASPLEPQTLSDIKNFVSGIDQIAGLTAKLEIVSAEAVSGGPAPYYLLSYCDNNSAAFTNAGYALQKADLYIQSVGLGCGWFMGVKPKANSENFCISLAFGGTDIPARKTQDDFKRLPLKEISPADNAIARAVRLAPSAMNSQPWKLEFQGGKVVVKDIGRGIMRVMLRSKMNKIDIGIAVRHAVTALEQEGKQVTGIIPKETGKEFEVEILFK
jgi:hypothetical protein